MSPIAPLGLEPIAVVGMSGRFPGAQDVDQLWTRLLAGNECLTVFGKDELLAAGIDPELVARPDYVPVAGLLEDGDCFDAEFFGYSPREAELMDPQHRVFLEQAWAALEHAGHAPRRFAGRIGVFAGAGINLYLAHQLLADPDLIERAGAYSVAIGNDKDFLATRVSYKLDLRGPSVSVQTACSTSLVAVCMACQSLTDAESDMALAGGVTVRAPLRGGYLFQEEGILSPDGHCRAFDAQARGTVPGSGAGVVVLRRLSDALRDGDHVHGLIRGWAINNDGARKVGFTAPSVEGQSEAIAEALAVAGVEPASIGYVEAHGTGTRLGDPVEMAALVQVFGAAAEGRPILIGSIKSNIGHLDAAAGVAGLIKTLLALRHGEIPASLHITSPNPELAIERAPFALCSQRSAWPRERTPRRAGVSSFGIGGTNAHVVLEAAPASAAKPARRASPELILLSAHGDEALVRRAADLAEHLARHPELDLEEAAWTLQVGREPLRHRLALVAESGEAAGRALAGAEDDATGRAPAAPRRAAAPDDPPQVAFLFPGQGAQHTGMGAGLYHAGGTFRAAVDACAEKLAPHLALDLRTVLYPDAALAPGAEARLERTELAQPALFTIGFALARQWMALGIRPTAMLGHSIGEYVAACLAGVLSLEDALALVAARGRLVQSLPGGGMDAVPLPENQLAPLLAEPLALAAVNGPALCTVSGPFPALEALEGELGRRGIAWRRLHTSHAFHSAMMDPILTEFARVLEQVPLRPPELPFVSNLTGTWITSAEACSREYWVRHLRSTVRFADGLDALADSSSLLLEAGPGRTLVSLAQRHPGVQGHARVASLPHPQDAASDAATFLGAAGSLWLAGAALDWTALPRPGQPRRVPLPTYPFARTRHWLEPPRDGRTARRVVRRADQESWFTIPSWRRVAPLPPLQRSGEGTPARWLVLGDDAGLGGALDAQLAERGCERAIVSRAAGFARLGPRAWAIDPECAADHERVLRELQNEGFVPGAMLHLWSVDEGPALVGAAGLLRAAQAFARVHPAAPLALVVVTAEVAELTGAERGAAEGAAAAALGQVLAQERPGLVARQVDVERAEEPAALAPLLARELGDAGARERSVALRGGHRWAPGFEPFRSQGPPPPALADGAHAVITGGLGRFGLAIAEHLARTCRARLTLLDRRPFPPREAWASLAADGAPESAHARRLLALESLGGRVRVGCCDVADPAAMSAALAGARAEFGPVTLALHGAAVPEEEAFRPLLETEPDHLRALLRPRLAGLRVLDTLLAGDPVTYRLAASSLASLLGGVGLGGFAAADACVDATARCGATKPWTVVNWEVWGSLAGDGAEGRPIGLRQAALMLTADDLCATFERVRAWPGLARVTIATGDLEARLAQATQGAARSSPSARAAGAPAAGRAPEGELESRIAMIWGETLGLENVGADADFFELGGNSLIGLQILSRLRAELEAELPLRAFFEARTVCRMARAIEEEREAAGAGRERMAELLAEIEALSDHEIASAVGEPAPARGEPA